jgi:hypothetical protein
LLLGTAGVGNNHPPRYKRDDRQGLHLHVARREKQSDHPHGHAAIHAPGALGFSKKLANLVACTSIYIAYYNFCWMHGSLNGTPAMAAKIAGHPWTLEELVDKLEE